MSENPKKKKETKIRKKDVIIGVSLIVFAFLGTWGTFAIMKVALKTEIPLVVVTSPSMVPAIEVGDMLVVEGKAPKDIINGSAIDKDGDIIIYDAKGLWPSYKLPKDNQPIVHRVIAKWYNETEQKYYFITKGDNNEFPDYPDGVVIYPVPEDHILGVVKTIIPKVGLVKIWLTEEGLAIPLIVILGILLVISIVYDITHPEQEEDEKKKALETIKDKKPETAQKPDMGM